MPKIYVANTSPRAWRLNYRVPTGEFDAVSKRPLWSQRLYVEDIPAGGQIALGNGKDFSDLEFKHLFEHHQTHYGAFQDGEQPRGFVGLIFGTKEIKRARIESALKQNTEASEELSNKMIDHTTRASLESQTQRAQETNTPAPARVELEIAAEKSRDVDVAGKGAEATQPGVTPRKPETRGKGAQI